MWSIENGPVLTPEPLLLHYDIHNFGKAFLLTDFRGNALILFASYIHIDGYEYGGFYRNIMHFYNVTDIKANPYHYRNLHTRVINFTILVEASVVILFTHSVNILEVENSEFKQIEHPRHRTRTTK